MRIAWAIPCVRVRTRADGLLDLLGSQIDSVVLPSLPTEIEFDVAIRLTGPEQDFAQEHLVQVVLSDPQLEAIGTLDLPVYPRAALATHIPGYEINANLGARIAFEPYDEGGYDLSFALDGEAQHRHKTTLSAILREP